MSLRISETEFYNDKDVITQIEWLKDHIGGARLNDVRLVQDTDPESPYYGRVTMTFVMEDGKEYSRYFDNVAVTKVEGQQEGDILHITFYLANGQTYTVDCVITTHATVAWASIIGDDPRANVALDNMMSQYDTSVQVTNKVNAEKARAELAEGALDTAITGEAATARAAESALSGRIDNIVATLTDILYPIGSIYMTTSAANPGTWLEGTTWTEYAKGRTIIGVSESHPSQSEGGSETVTLSVNQMPAHAHNTNNHSHTVNCHTDGSHTHTVPMSDRDNGHFSASGNVIQHSGTTTTSTSGSHTHTIDIGQTNVTVMSNGGGEPHNNMPPFIATYIWVRTA